MENFLKVFAKINDGKHCVWWNVPQNNNPTSPHPPKKIIFKVVTAFQGVFLSFQKI